MKRYALLRWKDNETQVIFETKVITKEVAIQKFNKALSGVQLDKNGFGKLNDMNFYIAEYIEPFYSV